MEISEICASVIQDYEEIIAVILFPYGSEEEMDKAIEDFSKEKGLKLLYIEYFWNNSTTRSKHKINVESFKKYYENKPEVNIVLKQELDEYETDISYLLADYSEEFCNFMLERGFNVLPKEELY